MKRFVGVLSVLVMWLAWALATVVLPAGPASAALPGASPTAGAAALVHHRTARLCRRRVL
jgi:hypothetical protein